MAERDRGDAPPDKARAAAFRSVLNSHGHAFHQAVLRYIHRLRLPEYGSRLRFEVSECPVELHGKPIRIDFVLKFGEHYLVGECKRANPAIASWCFAKTPYVRRNQGRICPVFSAPVRSGVTGIVDDMPHRITTEVDIYQIAAELRTSDKGEEGAGGRGAIDHAVTQVFRSAGGWIELLKSDETRRLSAEPQVIIPVIFTTAKLFVTDADLGEADLQTGNLGDIDLIPKPWIWFQVALTRDLRPELRPNPIRDDGSPSAMLLTRLARAVAIVSVGGIRPFLTALCDEDLFLERI
jgi:hypothetical protein